MASAGWRDQEARWPNSRFVVPARAVTQYFRADWRSRHVDELPQANKFGVSNALGQKRRFVMAVTYQNRR